MATGKDSFVINKKQLGYALVAIGLLLVLILVFVKINYDTQSASLCDAIDAAGEDMESCPVHKTDASWLFMGGFAVSSIIVVLGGYLGFIEKPSIIVEKKEFAALDESKLDVETKQVYHLLKQREGSLFQSDLIRETNFSKVKVSRILDKLEQDQVIERKRRGMTNLIVLR